MNPRPRTLIGGQVAAEAAGLADQSLVALADAVKAGWAYPSELKEPDFDALRGREDFQKLFAEVGGEGREGARDRPAPAGEEVTGGPPTARRPGADTRASSPLR